MKTRSLVLTPLKLRHLDRNVHGAYQRLRSLVEAVCGMTDMVDVYSLVPPEGCVPGELDIASMDELQQHWGVRCNVINGRYAVPRLHWPWLVEQASWAWSYRRSQLFAGYFNPDSCRVLQGLLNPAPTLVVAHKLPTQELLRGMLPGGVPVIFDLDDIEHVAFARQVEHIAGLRDRLVARAMVPSIRRAVRRAIGLSRRTLVCSEHDRLCLKESFGLAEDKLAVVPNACVIRDQVRCPTRLELLFVGTFVWPPNVQAVEFFIGKCWPLIREAVPAARFTVVGANPELIPSHGLSVAGVTFAGFVPDIEAVYRQARVVVCPILSGGGTRVKLVEAAAYGKPIVSTRIGAEGLDFEDGKQALLRDGIEEFAAACVRLLSDDELCGRLGEAAHKHAREKFDRTVVVEQIRGVARTCVNAVADTR